MRISRDIFYLIRLRKKSVSNSNPVLGWIFFSIMFFCVGCKQKECHNTITIHNKTNTPVIFARVLGTGTEGNCFVHGDVIDANGHFESFHRYCREDQLKALNFEFSIIDTSNVTLNMEYSCDSLSTKNTVLKVYSVSLKELQASNFNVYYP